MVQYVNIFCKTFLFSALEILYSFFSPYRLINAYGLCPSFCIRRNPELLLSLVKEPCRSLTAALCFIDTFHILLSNLRIWFEPPRYTRETGDPAPPGQTAYTSIVFYLTISKTLAQATVSARGITGLSFFPSRQSEAKCSISKVKPSL